MGEGTHKLPLNIDKTNFSLFLTSEQKENLLLTLPLLSVDGLEIKQVTLAKFFEVQIYKNINWEQQINLVQCKISKNLGICLRQENCLNLNRH